MAKLTQLPAECSLKEHIEQLGDPKVSAEGAIHPHCSLFSICSTKEEYNLPEIPFSPKTPFPL